jgi:hypothetical protein
MANAIKNMAFLWHRLFHEKQSNKVFIFYSNIFHYLLRLLGNTFGSENQTHKNFVRKK